MTPDLRRALDDLVQALNDADPQNGTEAAALGRLQDAVTDFCAATGLDEPLFLS